ncbi:glycosyltransferase family 9 protein [Hydrogenobaculum acidophilum]
MRVLFLVLHKSYGDLLYNALLFKAIKLYNKSAVVEVFTTKQGLELFQKNPYIDFMDDKVSSFKKEYDFLIDTSFKGVSYFYSFILKAQNKVALYKKDKERFLSFIYNSIAPFHSKSDEIKNTLQILTPVLGKEIYIEPYFWIFKENPLKGKNYVVISPTAPVLTKVPDIEIFNLVASFVHSKGYEVVFTYPKKEEFYIKRKLDFATYISTDIHTFASIVKDAKALISCETFSYHLATFLNVPSLVLLGAYPMWKISSLQDFVSLNLDCQYCGSKVCKRKDRACLNINPQDVILKTQKLL